MSRCGWLWFAVVSGAWAGFGPAPEPWVYDRAAVAAGQWWRLITGHFVHADIEHFAWNAAALATLTALFKADLGRRLPAVLGAGILGVDLFLLGNPQLAYYCGLSGILNTVLAAALVMRILTRRDRALASAVLLAALAKVLYEMGSGQALLTQISWTPVPGAHLFGLAAGLIYAVTRPVNAPQSRTTLEARP